MSYWVVKLSGKNRETRRIYKGKEINSVSPCLVAQTPMDKLITDIAFLVIAHHGGIQKPWEEEKAENEKHDEQLHKNDKPQSTP